MKVYQITDPEFAKYGRIISGYDFSGLIRHWKAFLFLKNFRKDFMVRFRQSLDTAWDIMTH